MIGDQMTQIFKDDYLYEEGLIDNPNFKLFSLRDFSALNFSSKIDAENGQAENNQDKVEEAVPVH